MGFFDIFGGKADDKFPLDEMLTTTTSATIDPNTLTTTTSSGTTLDPNLLKQLQTLPQTIYGKPLTTEETKELAELEKQHIEEVKKARLSAFKKLPSELRQFVVNFIVWQSSVKVIGDVKIEKSERLKELQMRHGDLLKMMPQTYQQMMNQMFGPVFEQEGSRSSVNYRILLQIPDNITDEELLAAHTEASIEEQMLED